jgi:hypothetical protein
MKINRHTIFTIFRTPKLLLVLYKKIKAAASDVTRTFCCEWFDGFSQHLVFKIKPLSW